MLCIFITHKKPPSLAGPEPTEANPMGPVASTLTTRPLRVAFILINSQKIYNLLNQICFLLTPIQKFSDVEGLYYCSCKYSLGEPVPLLFKLTQIKLNKLIIMIIKYGEISNLRDN
jgi:hypothetical protein